MLRPWLELARISNLPTVWTNVTAAWLLAGGPWVDVRLGWLLLAGSLLYTGGMILNDAADARHDQEHKKERPIPSGRVTAGLAWAVGLVMMIIGAGVAVSVAGASFWITVGLVGAILFYDLYHKPWPGAVWVMGTCRVLLYAMAGSAISDSELGHLGGLKDWVAIFALSLGAYIVGLTMVARMEARGAVVSPLHVVFARLLLGTPALVAVYFWLTQANWRLIPLLGDLTPLAPLVFILLFIGMVLHAMRVMRQGGPAIGRAVGILLAGIAVVDALAVMQVSLQLACVFVLIAPCLRLWQRWIAAT